MPKQPDPIKRILRDALAGGYAISTEQIRQLRARSEKEISTLKTVFWIALGLFNLMIWDPFTTPIPLLLRWVVAIGALLISLVFPIIGIRRHRRCLYLLEDSTRGPKRRQADEAGRKYMDQVKKQGRVFVRAEFELLEGESTT